MSLRMWRDENFHMLLTGEKPLGEILTYLVSLRCAYLSKRTNFTSQISLEKLGSFMILANSCNLLEDQVRTPHLQNRINKHV